MPTREKEGPDAAVYKVLRKRPLDYDALAAVVTVADGLYSVRNFRCPDRLLRLTAARLDFSGARFAAAAGLGHADLTDCLFTGTTYEGNVHGSFTRCGFARARFRRAGFAVGADFRGCDFSGARFTGFEGHDGTFEDCAFDGCEFVSASFAACKFIRCSFRGATFKDGFLGACELVDLRSNLTWVEDPPGDLRSFAFAGADHTTDLGDTMMTGTKLVRAAVKK